jgi:hypothetical protein
MSGSSRNTQYCQTAMQLKLLQEDRLSIRVDCFDTDNLSLNRNLLFSPRQRRMPLSAERQLIPPSSILHKKQS